MIKGIREAKREIENAGFKETQGRRDSHNQKVCIYVKRRGESDITYRDENRKKSYFKAINKIVVHDSTGKISLYYDNDYKGKVFAQYGELNFT